MRKSALPILAAFALLAGCVTVNVYFPAAAAQKAADKVIGNIIGPDASGQTPAPASSVEPPAAAAAPADTQPEPVAMRMLDAMIPTASAAEPDMLHVKTPAIEAIEARMRNRFHSVLEGLLESGAIGFTHNGDITIHDASKIPLSQRTQARQAVAAENSDRAELYKQVAVANGHPEWATRMREAFAKRWIAMAHPGWYYQDASGNWQKK